MKTYAKIALFVVFFIALGGIGAALYMYNLKHKDLQNIKPDFFITAVDLQKAFNDDEAAATIKYVKKVLEISGIIESVKTGEERVINLTLKTENNFSSVICTFPASAESSKLKAGDQITLKGECSGFLMDVLINNCTVISK
jgi:hypothetical protein